MYLPGIHVICRSCRAPYSLLIQIKRKVLSQRSGYDPSKSKGWVPRPAASVFNTVNRQGETRKTAICSTLLRRITSYKSVNSASIEGSFLSQKGSLMGLMSSCRLDMSHTLELKQLFEFCCGMHRSWHRPQKQNLTRREFIGRRELAPDAQYSCGRCSSPP